MEAWPQAFQVTGWRWDRDGSWDGQTEADGGLRRTSAPDDAVLDAR